MLAGGNGAGKSTFYRTRLESLSLPFINVDILAKQIYPEQPEKHSYEAAKIAGIMRTQLLQQGRTFCYETVFSHPSKIDFLAQAKAPGLRNCTGFDPPGVHFTLSGQSCATGD